MSARLEVHWFYSWEMKECSIHILMVKFPLVQQFILFDLTDSYLFYPVFMTTFYLSELNISEPVGNSKSSLKACKWFQMVPRMCLSSLIVHWAVSVRASVTLFVCKIPLITFKNAIKSPIIFLFKSKSKERSFWLMVVTNLEPPKSPPDFLSNPLEAPPTPRWERFAAGDGSSALLRFIHQNSAWAEKYLAAASCQIQSDSSGETKRDQEAAERNSESSNRRLNEWRRGAWPALYWINKLLGGSSLRLHRASPFHPK